ncbi:MULTISPECIES: DUF456 domain-containing protein [Streptomyces]|uniref:Uncharacterized protein YqgC (DUF456 family) n=1 Tax=Streptomyces clavifer TaxID=68188 RepID=A0ABS4V2P1_9ACTN|nr:MULTISPECIES: DUF456 domain-containing protein [Streptomyces]MBP2358174.1 uncharacterized protein YqgC (DUF456 family) [Streptomyces clavifer]MDX2742164.1 DUF456 domain-containing protein [Streptomyces sp. NRRL_B-2557]MDX3067319.1 DUF456 domain-containing protein [Streptomyces sp. ND04-05B]WRY85051.1 DUF456 domain-containing protein [Streptomyces clavifer]WUC30757.1 DUF456 domain-containing protein [Streptomyces clavifer]
MSVWQLVAVGAVMLLGLVGVLVPGVPGRAIVWAAVLWWALTDTTAVAWGVLIGATCLMLLNQALKATLPSRRPREAGAPRRTLVLGGLAAIAGFFVVPVVGGILGYVGAIYGAERLRLGSHGAGWASLKSVMRTTGHSVLLELYCCLMVAGAWLGAVIWG